MVAAISYLSTQTNTASQSSYTYSGISLGTAAADRVIAVAVNAESDPGNEGFTGCTIGGVTATKVVFRNGAGTNDELSTAIFVAEVPTGATGNVVVTCTSTHLGNVTHVYRLTGVNPTPHATGSDETDPVSFGLNVPEQGVLLGAAVNFTAATAFTTTGLTEDYDASFDGNRHVAGQAGPIAAETPRTITFDAAAGGAIGCAASFAAGGIAYTATLDPASFVVTAQTLSVPVGRKAELSAASYAVTASDLSATTGRNVGLSAASYALTASDLAAVTGRNITLSPAAYAVTASSLAALTARSVTLSASSFVYTGQDLTTLLSRNVALSPAAYTYTGLDLDVVANIQVDYAVTLSPATFAFTGKDLTATYTAGTPPAAPGVPGVQQGGGGGGTGGARWFRGKYRHDIRKAIRRAVADLSGVRSSRSRKRKVRRIATEFVETLTFDVPVAAFAQVPDVAMLEPLRLQLLNVSLALKERLAAAEARAKGEEMARLFAAYEVEARRLDEQDEEEAIATVVALIA